MASMSHRKFFADVSVIGIAKILVSLKGLLLLPLITKMLGEESYGIWVQIGITISLMSYLFTLGLPFSLVRFLPGQKDKNVLRDYLYSSLIIVLLITSIVSIALIMLSNVIAPVLFGGRNDLLFLLCLVFPIYSANLLFLNFFRAKREMKKYSYGILFQSYSEVLLLYIIIFGGYGLYHAILSIFIINCILFIVIFTHISRKIGLSIPNFNGTRRLLGFGLPTVPSNFSGWIMQSSDKYLIVLFIGIVSVGIYSPAYTVGFIVSYIFAPLAFVLPPTLSELYDKNNTKEVRRYLIYSTQFLFFFAIPAFFGLSLFSREILILLSTKKIANEGYMVVPIVAASVLFWGLSSIYSQTIVLAKKTKIIGYVTVIGALTNLLLNILFIPVFGIIGAAFTTLIAYGVLAVGHIYFSRRFLHFSVNFRFIIKVILSSLIMFFILFGLKSIININGLLMIVTICLGFFIYISLIFVLKGLELNMIKEIKKAIQK